MIPHAEFRRAAWLHWGRHLALWFGVLALGSVVFGILWFILELVDPGEAAEMRAEYAMAVAIVVGLATALMAARSAGRDPHDDPRLICPHCDGAMNYYYVMIVLTSKNCPHCGERVLED